MGRVLRSFPTNQGILLAGAVAYYALLSLVPLVILLWVALSHVAEPAPLMTTLYRFSIG